MFGKKRKQAEEQAAQATQAAQQAAAQAMGGDVPPVSAEAWQQAQAATDMQRGLGIDTAAFGGPSNAPVADDDPIWEPIGGITLEHYAWISKLATKAGVTDEAGTKALAQENGLDPDQYWAGAQGWAERMGQNMAVGQRWRAVYDQY